MMISFILKKKFVLDILAFDSIDSQFSDKRKLIVKENSMFELTILLFII